MLIEASGPFFALGKALLLTFHLLAPLPLLVLSFWNCS